jgi:hypothetical protein
MSAYGISYFISLVFLMGVGFQKENQIIPTKLHLASNDPYFEELPISSLQSLGMGDSLTILLNSYKGMKYFRSRFYEVENGPKFCYSVLNKEWLNYSDSCKRQYAAPVPSRFNIRWSSSERGKACNHIYKQMALKLIFEFKAKRSFAKDEYIIRSVAVKKLYATRFMSGGILELIPTNEFVLLPTTTESTIKEFTTTYHFTDMSSMSIPFWSDHLSKINPGNLPPKKLYVVSFHLNFVNRTSDVEVPVTYGPVVIEM